MSEHHCVLCIGSNTGRQEKLSYARQALAAFFPDIRFGEIVESEAVGEGFRSPFSNQSARFTTSLSPESLRQTCKEIEKQGGRMPEDKARGIVKLDIDVLVFYGKVLKPEDLKRAYIRF